MCDLVPGAFHQGGAADHLQRFESQYFEQEEFLELLDDAFPEGGAGLEGLAETEFEVVQQADAGRHHALPLAQFLEEGDASFEVGEDQGAVFLAFGPGVELEGCPGDDAQAPLAAEQQALGLHAGGVARGGVPDFDIAGRGHQTGLDDDFFDVAVLVLLHAAGVGGDPASQGGQFDAVRVVAGGVAPGEQLFFHLPAADPRLDAGLEVLFVDPEDAVHALHVDRGNGALLGGRQGQRAADVGAAAVRDQDDVVFAGQADDVAHFVLVLRVEDQVDGALQGRVVEQAVDLVDAQLAVAVDQPVLVVEGDLVLAEPLSDSVEESLIPAGFGHDFVADLFDRVLGAKGHAEDFLGKGDEVGHAGARERIAAAGHAHGARVFEFEAGVGVSPAVREALACGQVVGECHFSAAGPGASDEDPQQDGQEGDGGEDDGGGFGHGGWLLTWVIRCVAEGAGEPDDFPGGFPGVLMESVVARHG